MSLGAARRDASRPNLRLFGHGPVAAASGTVVVPADTVVLGPPPIGACSFVVAGAAAAAAAASHRTERMAKSRTTDEGSDEGEDGLGDLGEVLDACEGPRLHVGETGQRLDGAPELGGEEGGGGFLITP